MVEIALLAHVHLLAIGLRHGHRGGLGLGALVPAQSRSPAKSHRGFGVIAVLRGHFAFVEELLHAPQIVLIALQLRARLVQLRVA